MDITIEKFGSFFLVTPRNKEARKWLTQNTNYSWWGESMIVDPEDIQSFMNQIENSELAYTKRS